MIVRCPECSTGFKLPASKITEKPVKLRCSKCSHVFHFRLGDSGEADVFLTDDDRAQNEGAKSSNSGKTSASSDSRDDDWESRSEEHTSELQSRPQLVCRLLLEKKKRCAAPCAASRPAPH